MATSGSARAATTPRATWTSTRRSRRRSRARYTPRWASARTWSSRSSATRTPRSRRSRRSRRSEGRRRRRRTRGGASGPMTVRLDDPEARLQHARDVAWKALNRRERTVAELGRHLAAKRVEPSAIETVLAELSEQGYLDDASYAQRFVEDRRRLDAWGAERIERKLLALGVDREVVAAAIGDQDHAGEMDAALEILARRFPEPPQ